MNGEFVKTKAILTIKRAKDLKNFSVGANHGSRLLIHQYFHWSDQIWLVLRRRRNNLLYKHFNIVLLVPMMLGKRRDFDCTQNCLYRFLRPSLLFFYFAINTFAIKVKRFLSKYFRGRYLKTRFLQQQTFVNLLPNSGRLEPSLLRSSLFLRFWWRSQ